MLLRRQKRIQRMLQLSPAPHALTIPDLLKLLADPTRLRILNLLSNGERCVCELTYLLDIKQSNLSKHLGALSRSHVITSDRRNKFVFYQLDASFLKAYPFAGEILTAIKKEPPFTTDDRNDQAYCDSDLTRDCLCASSETKARPEKHSGTRQ